MFTGLPEEATWTYLRENAEQDDIKVKVDKAFVSIDEILAEEILITKECWNPFL